jgi:hypothetical protein
MMQTRNGGKQHAPKINRNARPFDASKKIAILNDLKIQLVPCPHRPREYRDCCGYIQIDQNVKLWIEEKDTEIFMRWIRDGNFIPLFLLEYMRKHKGEDMRLLKDKLDGLNGACFVHEELSQDGPLFLVTKHGQSDLAFSGTGYDAQILSPRYSVIGQLQQHTTYAVDLPPKMLDNWVHKTRVGCGYMVGDRIRFMLDLKPVTKTTSQVQTE